MQAVIEHSESDLTSSSADADEVFGRTQDEIVLLAAELKRLDMHKVSSEGNPYSMLFPLRQIQT